jgi:hypothetical protein
MNCLPHTTRIDDRAAIAFELLGQLLDLLLVGEEVAIVVGDLVRQDRLVARRPRHVAARRPGRQPGLLSGDKSHDRNSFAEFGCGNVRPY